MSKIFLRNLIKKEAFIRSGVTSDSSTLFYDIKDLAQKIAITAKRRESPHILIISSYDEKYCLYFINRNKKLEQKDHQVFEDVQYIGDYEGFQIYKSDTIKRGHIMVAKKASDINSPTDSCYRISYWGFVKPINLVTDYFFYTSLSRRDARTFKAWTEINDDHYLIRHKTLLKNRKTFIKRVLFVVRCFFAFYGYNIFWFCKRQVMLYRDAFNAFYYEKELLGTMNYKKRKNEIIKKIVKKLKRFGK